MKLAIIPINAMPDDQARKEEILKLGAWLSRSLSLTGDNSADRLEVILPMIQKYAWTMSCEEIKRGFDLYIESKLSYNGKPLEPIDNYLTPILFNKVIKAFKDSHYYDNAIKKRPELPQPTEDDENYFHAMTCFDHFVQHDNIPQNMIWIYDFLTEKGIFEHSKEDKLKLKKVVSLTLKHENLSSEELTLETKKRFLIALFEELK